MKFWEMNLKLVYIYKTQILKFQKWKLKKLYSDFQNFGILIEMEFWKTYLKLVFKKTGFGILEI